MWLPTTQFVLTDHAYFRYQERIKKNKADLMVALRYSSIELANFEGAKQLRKFIKEYKKMNCGRVLSFHIPDNACFVLKPLEVGKFLVMTVLRLDTMEDWIVRNKYIDKMKGSKIYLQ